MLLASSFRWLAVGGMVLASSIRTEAATAGSEAGASQPVPFATPTDLVATPAAPTGARGVVTLVPAGLTLEIERLHPGLYQLDVARSADSTWVPVGLIAVSNPNRGPEQRAGEDRNERSLAYQAEVLKIRSQAQLPPGLPPSDISQVTVSDLGGNVLLTTTPASQTTLQ